MFFNNEKLQATLKIAEEAIKDAKKHITISSTSLNLSQEKIKENYEKVDSARLRTLDKVESLYELFSIPNNRSYKYWKRSVKNSKKHQSGNCQEYSDLVINFLRKQNIPAEELFIVDGGHVFVVIGRKEKSELNDYTTWGEEAVICDATLGICFPASEIKDKLKCYDESCETYNRYYPYTNEKFELLYSTGQNKTPNYQQNLIKEAVEKISLIADITLTSLNLSEEEIKSMQFENFKNSLISLKNMDTVDSDMERMTNRCVRKALKSAESFAKDTASKNNLHQKLLDAICVYIKKLPAKEYEEQIFSTVSGYSGVHSKDVKVKLR